ncbi:MAG: hypothetical protein HYZ53_20805 [Planctomycetes bacterium]|nr:hypothetical protein [Planctomycetota bacterium]
MTWKLVRKHLGGKVAEDEYVEALVDLPGLHRWFHTLRDFKVGLTVEGLSLAGGDEEELRKLRVALKGHKSTARGEESPVTSGLADTPTIGFLRWLGYHVGAGGPGAKERQDILQSALSAQVPIDEFSEGYARQWGPPDSQVRLAKIETSIDAFSRNRRAALRNAGLSDSEVSADDAVADWDEDIQWLRDNFHGDFKRPGPRG